jgi:hypothetical protein
MTQRVTLYKAIEYLSQNLDKLKAVTCEHHLVMNSETERECQLGCTHDNLSDKPRLLKESGKPDYASKPTHQEVLSQYSDYIRTILDRMNVDARRWMHEAKRDDPDYDYHRGRYFCFQDDVTTVQSMLYKLITRLKEGKSAYKKYHLDFGYKSEIESVYSDDLNQILRLARSYDADGIQCTVYEQFMDGTHYNNAAVAYVKGPEAECDICGDHIYNGKVVITKDGRYRHTKCQKKIDDQHRTVTRSITIPMTEEQWEKHACRYNDWYEAMESYLYKLCGEYPGVHHVGPNKAFTKLHVRVKAMGLTIDKIKEAIASN